MLPAFLLSLTRTGEEDGREMESRAVSIPSSINPEVGAGGGDGYSSLRISPGFYLVVVGILLAQIKRQRLWHSSDLGKCTDMPPSHGEGFRPLTSELSQVLQSHSSCSALGKSRALSSKTHFSCSKHAVEPSLPGSTGH